MPKLKELIMKRSVKIAEQISLQNVNAKFTVALNVRQKIRKNATGRRERNLSPEFRKVVLFAENPSKPLWPVTKKLAAVTADRNFSQDITEKNHAMNLAKNAARYLRKNRKSKYFALSNAHNLILRNMAEGRK